MRFIMLSLERSHPFHSPELSERSVGIHIQPVINKSYRDQLGVLQKSKPGCGENKAVTQEEQEKGLEKRNKTVGGTRKCVCDGILFANVTVCVPDIHMRGIRLCVILVATVDANDNLLSAIMAYFAVFSNTSRITTNL